MSATNELIVQIESARTVGNPVKSIRRQKFDPNNFYITLTNGRQVGPVKVEGNIDELNRKFGEAQSYLGHGKSKPAPQRAAA